MIAIATVKIFTVAFSSCQTQQLLWFMMSLGSPYFQKCTSQILWTGSQSFAVSELILGWLLICSKGKSSALINVPLPCTEGGGLVLTQTLLELIHNVDYGMFSTRWNSPSPWVWLLLLLFIQPSFPHLDSGKCTLPSCTANISANILCVCSVSGTKRMDAKNMKSRDTFSVLRESCRGSKYLTKGVQRKGKGSVLTGYRIAGNPVLGESERQHKGRDIWVFSWKTGRWSLELCR